MKNLPGLSSMDAEEVDGLVQDAFYSAGGEVIVLGVLSGTAAYLIIEAFFASVLDTGVSVGVFFGLLAVLASVPTDWYIKHRMATRLREKCQE